VGTAGGPADGVSLPRNNLKLRNASMPNITVAMKHIIYEHKNKFE
jgi:hypothetical protein